MTGILRPLKPGQTPKIIRPANWRAMAPDKDPQNLAEDQPFLAINTRLKGGQHVIRGGQQRIVNLGGEVTGLATHQVGGGNDGGRPGRPLVFSGVTRFSSGTFVSTAEFLDEEMQPSAVRVAGGFSGSGDVCIAVFGDDLIIGKAQTIYRWTTPPFGAMLTDGGGITSVLQEPLAELPSATGDITAMVEQNGVLIVATYTNAGPGARGLYKFDGITLTLEESGTDRVYALDKFDDRVVAMVGARPRIRSADGVWSASTGIAISAVDTRSTRAAQYRGVLNIPIATDGVYQMNAAGVISLIPAATTGVVAGNGQVLSFSVLEDVLYFLWGRNDSGFTYIGKYDGTTWTATYKDLTNQTTFADYLNQPTVPLVSAGVTSNRPRGRTTSGMCVYRGRLVLFAGPLGTSGIPIVCLYISPRGNITGDWARFLPVGLDTGGAVYEMLVY